MMITYVEKYSAIAAERAVKATETAEFIDNGADAFSYDGLVSFARKFYGDVVLIGLFADALSDRCGLTGDEKAYVSESRHGHVVELDADGSVVTITTAPVKEAVFWTRCDAAGAINGRTLVTIPLADMEDLRGNIVKAGTVRIHAGKTADRTKSGDLVCHVISRLGEFVPKNRYAVESGEGAPQGLFEFWTR